MPATVTRAAELFLATAGRWRRTRFPRDFQQESGPVHIVVEKDADRREIYLTLGQMREADSPHAPLWMAFTSWLGPMLVVLFGDAPSHPAHEESPALTRARGLCRKP